MALLVAETSVVLIAKTKHKKKLKIQTNALTNVAYRGIVRQSNIEIKVLQNVTYISDQH